MKKITLFLAIALAPALALANDNQAPGSNAILEVEETDNGDGSYTYDVFINPNLGIDTGIVAFIDTRVTGNLLQSYLEDQNLIDQNDGSANVDFTSQQQLGDLDPAYDGDRDTVFNDSIFLGLVDFELDPAGDGDPTGTVSQRVAALTFTAGVAYLPTDELSPIWHVTTWGRNLRVTGIVQTDLDEDGRFAWHIPEPSTLLLAGLGAVSVLVLRRRRSS